MALIGTNGQGVGTSAFQQWSNNCKKNLSSDQMKLFEQFVDNAYDVMEKGNFSIINNIKNYKIAIYSTFDKIDVYLILSVYTHI